jgi:hypothetical protein
MQTQSRGGQNGADVWLVSSAGLDLVRWQERQLGQFLQLA